MLSISVGLFVVVFVVQVPHAQVQGMKVPHAQVQGMKKVCLQPEVSETQKWEHIPQTPLS